MSLPYFPMYPDDFEADTAHLSLLEDGVYNRLLRLCWRTPGCSIPADEAWIMRKLRARTDEEIEAVRIILDEFFRVEAGRYFSPRLRQEWVEANERHERRKKAGAKGGSCKALKTKKTAPSNAKAKPKQPEPEPEPYNRVSDETLAREALEGIASPQIVADFLAHRKAMKKPVTERAAKAMVKKLDGHHDPDAVLTDSIANGWQGIFPEKTKPSLKAINGGSHDRPANKSQRRIQAWTQGARGAFGSS